MTALISSSLFRSLQEGALLVTANQRLSRAFTDAFNQMKQGQGETVWPSPWILPLDAWWQTLHADFLAIGLLGTRLLSEQQQRAIWIKCIEGSGAQAVLLSVEATASELAKSWRIENAYARAANPWSHYFTEDQRAYQLWSNSYRDYCGQHQFTDLAQLPTQVIAILNEHARQPGSSELVRELLPEQMILTGFSQLTPQLQAVLQACSNWGVEVVPAYQPESVVGQAVRTRCTDSGQELLSAAQWARQKLTEKGAASDAESNGAIAVVIPDLHARRAEVERTFDAVFFPGATPAQISQQGRPYEISLGLPLSQFAPVSSALQILTLGFDMLSGSAISEFLLSPYLLQAESEKNQRSLFDSRLRALGIRSARLYQLLDAEPPRQLTRLLKAMRDASSSAQGLPSAWLARMDTMLESAGWPGQTAPQSIEYQAIQAWHSSMEELLQLDELLGPISARRMLTLVRQLSDSRIFQPHSPVLPVQIMGTLESIGQVFRAIWLSGFDNESWPQLQKPSAFLPMKWQKAVLAPGASLAHELSVARTLLKAFQSAATDVVFSHPQTRNDNDLDCSQQIAELPEKSLDELTGMPPESAVRQVYTSLDCESVEDIHGPEIEPGTAVRGGARLFEDQAKCPFRAFALHRLQARPLEEAALGLDVRDKGNFFHDAMERFWLKTVGQEQLIALSDEDLLSRITECIQQAITDNTSVNARQNKARLLIIEQQRLERIVYKWIQSFEMTRAPFVVEQMEQDEIVEFESLKLRLKLDRLDKLTDGGRIIVDYKTGRNNSITSWTEERITSPQLPLYAIIMKDIHAVCFAQVAVNQQRFLGMAKERGLLAGLKGPQNDTESWSERLSSWRDNLAAIAREVRRGYAAVAPARLACQFCELPAVCRIDSQQLEPQVTDATAAGEIDRGRG